MPTATELGDPLTARAYRGIIVSADTPTRGRAEADRYAAARWPHRADFKAYLKQQYAAPDSVLFGTAASELIAAELAAARQFASN